jgi:hypothetical protein
MDAAHTPGQLSFEFALSRQLQPMRCGATLQNNAMSERNMRAAARILE